MTLPDDVSEQTLADRPWEILREALHTNDAARSEAILEEMLRSEALRALLQLSNEERAQLLTLVNPELAAQLIEEAPSQQAVDLVEHLEAQAAVEIIDQLDSDIQADVIGELRDQDAEAILQRMDPDDAADIRRLVEYDGDTAGGLMMAEVFSFSASETVGAVLRRLTAEDEGFERYRGQHPYIVDDRGRLVGVVSLRNLLLSKRSTALSEIMAPPLSVAPETSLDALEDLFDKHPFLGLPVVEEGAWLVGTVSRSAVADAALQRAETDSLKRYGVVGDELRSMPLLLRARRRLSWLSANIVLNVIAASVIAAYEETLAAVIAIAIFLPMVSDMSGCSGNQAVAVSLRELTLGLTKPIDALRVWLKEISVGTINGLVLGVLVAFVAWVWMGNPYLGLVIGLALALNTMISVSIGGTIPLMLKHFDIDPAVASGPLLTTVTDVAGFFLVLSLATLLMPLLIQ